MELKEPPTDDRRLSGTSYLMPTAPPLEKDLDMTASNPPLGPPPLPPSYEESTRPRTLPPIPPRSGRTEQPQESTNPFGEPDEDEQVYQVPASNPRRVNPDPPFELEKIPFHPKEDDATGDNKREDDINRVIKHNLKGFGSKEALSIKLVKVKGFYGIRRSKNYAIKTPGVGGELFGMAKTEPSSCDCLLNLLTCGCLKKSQRISLFDTVENESIYFQRPQNCCRVMPSLGVYISSTDRLIGTIVRQTPKPVFTALDENQNELFTIRGPLYSMFIKKGKMKFHATRLNPVTGKIVNIGLVTNGKCHTHVHFADGTKNDRVSKILMLAGAFMIEFMYYRRGVSKKDDKKN